MIEYSNLEGSIEHIYDQFYLDVYHFLISFTGNRNDAEDLTQEVFIRVLKSLSNFDTKKRLKTWILSISRNVAVDHYRRNKFFVIFKEGFFKGLPSNERNPNDIAELNEQREYIANAILSLKPSYRTVVILRGINELSIQETAEILDCSVSKVKVDYHRALKKLQTKLQINVEEVSENAR